MQDYHGYNTFVSGVLMFGILQDLITAAQIEKNQTWKGSTNRCDVDVKCAALGAESVSYLWSGFKTGSVSLSPAENDVTLNCTTANHNSNITATETLNCTDEQLDTVSLLNVEVLLLLISSLVTASPYLLVTIILGVKCYRARGQDHNSQYDATVIEE